MRLNPKTKPLFYLILSSGHLRTILFFQIISLNWGDSQSSRNRTRTSLSLCSSFSLCFEVIKMCHLKGLLTLVHKYCSYHPSRSFWLWRETATGCNCCPWLLIKVWFLGQLFPETIIKVFFIFQPRVHFSLCIVICVTYALLKNLGKRWFLLLFHNWLFETHWQALTKKPSGKK